MHAKFHAHEGTLGNCDLMRGRHLLEELGIDILCSTQQVVWSEQHAELPMKLADCAAPEHFFAQDPSNERSGEADRMSGASAAADLVGV